jgi:hypothetical protein
MKERIESLFYYLGKRKEKAIVIGLLTLQVLLLVPFLANVLSGKADYKQMEKEALSRTYEEDASENNKAFVLKSFACYWREGQKDLFLRPKRAMSSAVRILEQKRTVPLNYVGLYRTEKEATAMLKNTKTGKSFFCKEGDKAGDFKIVHIKRDILVVSAPSGELVHLTKGSKEEIAY